MEFIFAASTKHSCRLRILAILSVKAPMQTQLDALLKMRIKLCNKLVEWRKVQHQLCPTLKSHLEAVNPLTPEKDILLLPSAFDQPTREELGLISLTKIEYTLRKGQAYDALESVQEKIKNFNSNLDFKKANVFGQGPNTRAQNFLRELIADKVSTADKYRNARRALLSLGLSETDPSLKSLHNNQLFGKGVSRSAKLGDSKKEDPWFWTVGRPSGLSERNKQNGALNVSDRPGVVTVNALLTSSFLNS